MVTSNYKQKSLLIFFLELDNVVMEPKSNKGSFTLMVGMSVCTEKGIAMDLPPLKLNLISLEIWLRCRLKKLTLMIWDWSGPNFPFIGSTSQKGGSSASILNTLGNFY